MHPTTHEKSEWSRLATDAYANGLNNVGLRYSVAASVPDEFDMSGWYFDQLQRDYRCWLIDGAVVAFGDTK